jgi:hypothetical protein
MALQYSPETQQRVDAKVEAEVAASAKERREILHSLHHAVYDLNMSDTGRITTVVARFATLLVSLSIQADRIQRWMIWLTVAIAIMTLVLVALTVVMLCKMP